MQLCSDDVTLERSLFAPMISRKVELYNPPCTYIHLGSNTIS